MTGEYRNVIDDKGRLLIPSALRDQLDTAVGLKLTKSPDNTLYLYTFEEFEKLDAAVNSGPLAIFDENVKRLNRTVISPARDVEFDKVGRLSIPQVLREYAFLEPKTECVIQGSRDHIEIFALDVYNKIIEDDKPKLNASGNELSRQRMEK